MDYVRSGLVSYVRRRRLAQQQHQPAGAGDDRRRDSSTWFRSRLGHRTPTPDAPLCCVTVVQLSQCPTAAAAADDLGGLDDDDDDDVTQTVATHGGDVGKRTAVERWVSDLYISLGWRDGRMEEMWSGLVHGEGRGGHARVCRGQCQFDATPSCNASSDLVKTSGQFVSPDYRGADPVLLQ